MNQAHYFVVGVTHVDLAWKRGREEMSEMMEIALLRILDLLESEPEFRYHLEQVAHFREFARRRPDLIARLTPHLQSGRLEFVGGMASTLEANLPNGECFVRNIQIGLNWLQKTWNGAAPVRTGWLVDTFGIPAQTPQILQGFGIKQFMGSRFGGTHTHDLFEDVGLDGSRVRVTGWSSQAGYIAPVNVSWHFYRTWDGIDRCFEKADTLTGPGPYLLLPYTENEYLVSGYPQKLIDERNAERPHQHWRHATPSEYFEAVAQTGRVLPQVNGDLNPEFTGCFSLRHAIRIVNRRVETRLLEAEKWAALAGFNANERLENAWWDLAFVQFHDVFTGSHPTFVNQEVMAVLAHVEQAADTVLQQAFAQLTAHPQTNKTNNNTATLTLFNGLPWSRTDIAEVALPDGWAHVQSVSDEAGNSCPFVVQNNSLHVQASVPATGFTSLRLHRGEEQETAPAQPENDTEALQTVTLENEWVRAVFDSTHGIREIVWKPTGHVVVEAGHWLVAQRDQGSFQIENITGAEVSSTLR